MKRRTNFILCGFKGAGKTSVAKLLEERLKRFFIDSDEEIEVFSGKRSCRAAFEEFGEVAFRELEHRAIVNFESLENAIISLGGGSLDDPRNIASLKRHGRFCFLDVDREILRQRIKKLGMPLGMDFDETYERRYPLYLELADYHLKMTHESPQEVLEEVLNLAFE